VHEILPIRSAHAFAISAALIFEKPRFPHDPLGLGPLEWSVLPH